MKISYRKAEEKIPIGVSARHVHLSREHVEVLFGKEYQLTKKKDLMGGQFAAMECVTLVVLSFALLKMSVF